MVGQLLEVGSMFFVVLQQTSSDDAEDLLVHNLNIESRYQNTNKDGKDSNFRYTNTINKTILI